jgi:adenylate kinase
MSDIRKPDRSLWLRGPSEPCNTVPEENHSSWRLVLLGAPGVGKGTQAELLNQQLRACHLSTGDVFRTAGSRVECEQSPAIREAMGYMGRGELVPDTIVWAIIRERRACLNCAGGFILDGFPRTLGQAEALQELMQEEAIALDAVVNYELPFAEIVSRLGGRRTCGSCKAVYHVTERPSRVAGQCDKCSGNLLQRDDDRPESIAVRLEAYNRSTAPLIEFYGHLGLLVQIPAVGTPDEICNRSVAALQSRRVAQLSYMSMHEF